MNWMTAGLTSKKVGFEMDGSACEGGNCEHLKHGDKAYGYSAENDSFGSEVYLMCKACYEAFVAQKRVEPTECRDCHHTFPRNEMGRYIPYDADGSPGEQEQAKLWLCKPCMAAPRHQRRLEHETFLREQDAREDDDNWEPDFEPDDDFHEDD